MQTETKRVAILIADPADPGIEIARGVLDFRDHIDRWQFAGGHVRPFAVFDRIKLDEVDGVIGGFFRQTWIDAIHASGVAAVNTSNAFADADAALTRVASDEHVVGRMAGEHLLARGYQHYGFVQAHPRSDWASESRLAGYRAMLDENAGHSCHVFEGFEDDAQGNTLRFRNWLADLPKPIAIFAAVDGRALWVVRLASELGLRVPEDLAVIGVDDNHWASACAEVPLSSVKPDYRQIGYRAAKALDELMRGENPASPQWVSPLEVITRRSTDIVLQEDALVTEALRFIRDHFAEGIVVDDVLNELEVSRRSLELRMKKAIGQTPQVAISHAQIEKAKRMLVSTHESMATIARECGIRRQPQFSVLFKRLTGLTPGQYRQQRSA